MENLIYKEESYLITGICFDVHNILGPGFLEIVYKDALEYEFQQAGIPFEREKQYDVNYKGIMLRHNFFADFVVYDKIILEVKATSGISNDFVARAINYLTVSKNKLSIIANFGQNKFQSKLVVR
ncbi:MAG: GxxExxY protein [Bacteroidales bacterium]|nr:GxxExxY protein [Bacteroidales bacterium]MCF8457452.1 GxxExxY protein [Bacteroidales bacterium]